ncbi:MAG: ABC transporter ATP-binding protein [candidate division KSB1 bacterium]|nr:ABC transporter ATP-binding protein [candidate division KSB1 bacterium]
MIEVDRLTRFFGNVVAIEDVSFQVEKGEILGFLGPNAAGKTTTMRILTCYLPATRGTARVAGYDVFEDSLEVRKRIGYLPENPPLYPEMTVYSYLNFVSKIKGVDGKIRRKKIDEVMEKTNISHVKDTIIKNLSKGFKQRVGLAQALIHDPEVLILDEPTIGLDPKQIIEVRELIKSLAGEHTIILSTHILPEVSMTCERVVIINKGKIVAEDTPENLTAKLRGSERLSLEVEGPIPEVQTKLQKIKGVTKVVVEQKQDGSRAHYAVESQLNLDVRKELAKTVVESGWGLYEMRPIGMSLEEVFLHLTTEEEV